MAGNVIQPRIEAGYDGSSVRSYFQYDSGSSGAGSIYLQFRQAGSTTWGTARKLNDGSSDISCSDSGYSFSMAYDNQGRWLVALVLNGESAISDWFSCDNLHTWQRVV